jgi:IclR family transcriptional regulator, KDG regulon repressor
MSAIDKAIDLLDVFFKTEDNLAISDLARLADITPTTAYRITSILVKKGYVDQTHKRGKYCLSDKKLVDLAAIVGKRLKIRTIALPYIKELSKAIHENVELDLRRGHLGFNVAAVNRARLLDTIPYQTSFSLYSTAAGKVFLAYMSEKEFQSYIDKIVLQPRTDNTITDIGKLKKQLKEIKEKGFSFDLEENILGVNGIAAPVTDLEENVIAVITVIVPTTRMKKRKILEWAPLLKKYAVNISQAMNQ